MSSKPPKPEAEAEPWSSLDVKKLPGAQKPEVQVQVQAQVELKPEWSALGVDKLPICIY